MSGEEEKEFIPPALSEEERRVRDEVRSLSDMKPTLPFKQKLRKSFVAGDIQKREEEPKKSGSVIRGLVFKVLAPAAAAALIAVGVWNWDRPAAWEISITPGEGTLLVDGQAFSTTDFVALEPRLVSGARLILQAEDVLEILSEGMMAIQLTPGTEMVLPDLPGKLFKSTVHGELAMGEIRVVTGSEFHGSELRFHTEEADVQVMGSTMAVIRDSVSTCVCAFQGCIFMATSGGGFNEVPSGMRRFIYGDGRPTEIMPIDDQENMKLQMMLDASGGNLNLGEAH